MDINQILKQAAEHKASDLHIIFGQTPIIRVNGELFDINTIVEDQNAEKIGSQELEEISNSILKPEQKKRFLEKRDLDISYQFDKYRFRINFSFEKNNMRMVARVIDDHRPTLEEIGMPDVVKDLLELPQGFILVTGPTGCGKSTTLAAMVGYINSTRSANIITLEDPIEYIFKPEKSIISQRQLGSDMVSFASGLKHVLRQDPNVIMLGEMRDLETISTAITLAETGHLVLATLHTYSAAQTVDRMIDIFPPHQQSQIKSQLASVLTAVISQRLLPNQSGGRVAAREILIKNAAIGNLIREGKIAQIKSVLETGGSSGMITLDRHIKDLYQHGDINREVALENVEDQRLLNGL